MKRKRRPEQHPDVVKLFEAARRNTDSAPRKHHLVPRMHLANWAVEDKLRVVEVDTRKTWVTSPGKAGRRTDYYRIEHEDLPDDEIPPLLFEMVLGKVEDDASLGLMHLREDLPTGDWVQLQYDPAAMVPVVDFLAFQAVRGQRHRQTLRGTYTHGYKLMYAQLADRGLLQAELRRRLGREPTEDEVETNHAAMQALADGHLTVGPSDAQATAEVGMMAQHIRDFILNRNWRVYRTSQPLICSDEPVLVLGGPGTRRTETAGFLNAGVIAFPLGPDAVLAMFRPDIRVLDGDAPTTLNALDVSQLNRELAANATEYAFERPADNIATRITLPRWPSVVDMEGGYRTIDDPEAEVFRHFKRTRWANTSALPPWPVESWWSTVVTAPGAGFARHDTWSLSNLQPRPPSG